MRGGEMAKSRPPHMAWRTPRSQTTGGKGYPPYAAVLRRAQASPSRPKPSRAKEAGSGTCTSALATLSVSARNLNVPMNPPFSPVADPKLISSRP